MKIKRKDNEVKLKKWLAKNGNRNTNYPQPAPDIGSDDRGVRCSNKRN